MNTHFFLSIVFACVLCVSSRSARPPIFSPVPQVFEPGSGQAQVIAQDDLHELTSDNSPDVTTPEISDVARGLLGISGPNPSVAADPTFYPRLALDFVRNHVQYLPYYGC